jgi:hypothetical protein
MWYAWKRKVYKALMRKSERKTPLERPRRRWEVGIRVDLGQTGWGSVEWINVVQDRDRWRDLVTSDELAGYGATELVIIYKGALGGVVVSVIAIRPKYLFPHL